MYLCFGVRSVRVVVVTDRVAGINVCVVRIVVFVVVVIDRVVVVYVRWVE